MKQLLILFCTASMFSQVRFGATEYTSINLGTDPYASFKEGGVYVFANIERVENSFYVRGGFDIFPAIDGIYFYTNASSGINLKIGHFDQYRYYAGAKTGMVLRGGYFYANFGLEAGINYVFDNGFIIGLKTDYIYRDDFMYWGGSPEFIISGYLSFGFKI